MMFSKLCWAVVCVVLCTAGVSGLTVVSPPNLSGHILSPYFSILLGTQDMLVNVTGLGVLVTEEECGSSDFAKDVSDKVAVVKASPGRHVDREERVYSFLQSRGAIAVVRTTLGNVAVPGMTYTWTEPGLVGDVVIPVVQVLLSSISSVLDALEQGQPVLIRVTPDPNPWLEMYDSAEFLILMRIVIPALNVLGVLVAALAASAHFNRLVLADSEFDSPKFRNNGWLMLGGSGLIVESCTIRAVYFAIGPIFASSATSFKAHNMLLVTTIGTGLLTIAVCVSLFLRWGAFGVVNSWLKRNLDVILVIIGVADFVVAHILGYAQTHAYDVAALLLVCSVTILLSLLFSSVAFLVAGIRFIQTLRSGPEALGSEQLKARRLRKAVLWITVSGVCLLVQIVGTILSAAKSVVFTPRGFLWAFFLMFLGMSCADVAQGFALRPLEHRIDPFKCLRFAAREKVSSEQTSRVRI